MKDFILSIKMWFQDLFADWEPCPKELMGYTCRHRISKNGTRECDGTRVVKQ